MWNKLQKHDRIKLIYAYIISPIWIFLSFAGNITSEIYRLYGSSTASAGLSYSIRTAFILGMIGYLPIALPPTFIRFAVIQHKLKYGIEMSIFLSLSLFISFISYYFLTGDMPLTFGLLDTLVVYCILSYQSSDYSEKWHSYTVNPILFMLIALALTVLVSGLMTEQKQWHLPIWETIFACCVLTRHKDKSTPAEPKQRHELLHSNNTSEQSTHHNQPLEPPHRKPHQEPKPPQPPLPDIADTLIDIGLAHIGRTTARINHYITPELTQARHNIERPFLKLLAERYTDTQTRKALSRHFMLYKEVTLFMIFASVLRNDKPLHTKVQRKLKIRLSLGLPSKVIAKRNEYWRKLSEIFYESYTRTHDLAGTLDYTFWSVLPERIKCENFADLVSNGYLMQIFNYTRNSVAQEYAKISTGAKCKH